MIFQIRSEIIHIAQFSVSSNRLVEAYIK